MSLLFEVKNTKNTILILLVNNSQQLTKNEDGTSDITSGDREYLRTIRERMFPNDESNGKGVCAPGSKWTTEEEAQTCQDCWRSREPGAVCEASASGEPDAESRVESQSQESLEVGISSSVAYE